MRILLSLISIGFFYWSCGAEDASVDPETEAEDNFIESGGALITMSMTDDFILEVGVMNFVKVKQISFDLKFNYNVLSMSPSGYAAGDYNDPINPKIIPADSSASFLFQEVEGDGILFTQTFIVKGLVEGTTIYLSSLDIRNSNDAPVYITCSDQTFQNNVACLSNGGNWSYVQGEFFYESVCNIKEHPTNGEELFSGEYSWTNSYCFPIQNNWYD